MLKIILILLGLFFLLWVLKLFVKGFFALIGMPLTIVERRKEATRRERFAAAEVKFLTEAAKHQEFCTDVKNLDQTELAELWNVHDRITIWHAMSDRRRVTGEAKLLRKFDDERLFLCRTRDSYQVVRSDAKRTGRVPLGADTAILRFSGMPEWGRGWSVFPYTPEEYAKRIGEVDERKRAKDEEHRAQAEKERQERRAKLGLDAPGD